MKGKRKPETTHIGIRIDNRILRELDDIADASNTDRQAIIRWALEDFVDNDSDAMIDYAIKDYIQGRIEEKEFLDITDFEKVPGDVRSAREDFLSRIAKGERAKK